MGLFNAIEFLSQIQQGLPSSVGHLFGKLATLTITPQNLQDLLCQLQILLS